MPMQKMPLHYKLKQQKMLTWNTKKKKKSTTESFRKDQKWKEITSTSSTQHMAHRIEPTKEPKQIKAKPMQH